MEVINVLYKSFYTIKFLSMITLIFLYKCRGMHAVAQSIGIVRKLFIHGI